MTLTRIHATVLAGLLLSFALCTASRAFSQVLPSAVGKANPEADGFHNVGILVGNSIYGPGITKLETIQEDVKIIGERMEQCCLVDTKCELIDKPPSSLEEKVMFFKSSLTGKVKLLLFYYAGHGYQSAGENFLKFGTTGPDLRLQEVVRTLLTLEPETLVVFLDCCRLPADDAANGAVAKGLAKVQADKLVPNGPDRYTHVILSYAASPNEAALDRDPYERMYSPYAAALKLALSREGATIHQVLKKVQSTVEFRTNRQQSPYMDATGSANQLSIPLVIKGLSFQTPDSNDITKALEAIEKVEDPPTAKPIAPQKDKP